MDSRNFFIFFGILLLICATIPAVFAVSPQWTVKAAPSVSLSSVAISDDGSTIVAGGDQLMVLSPSGDKVWTGWSGSTVGLSRDGSYIITAQGTSVRLLNRAGTKLWDQSLGAAVADVSISPDATLIAAGGGSIVETWYNSGVGLGINTTSTIRHVRMSPAKDQVIVTTNDALRSFNVSCVQNWFNDTVSPDLVEVSGDGTGFVIPFGNHVRLYHGSGTKLWDITVPGPGNIVSLAYSRDGSTIVVGRDDGTVDVIDANGNILWNKKTGYWAATVAVSDNGSVIVIGNLDKTMSVFNRKGDLLGTFNAASMVNSHSVAVSGDGSLIAAVDSSNVYGFSTSQFTGAVPTGTIPVTTPASPTSGTVPVPSPSPATTAVTMSPAPAVTTIVPAGTTSAPGFPGIFAVLSLALVVLVRIRRG
jgi:hypothetical protein